MSKKSDYSIYDYIILGLYFFMYGIVKYFPSPLGDLMRYWLTKPFAKKLGRVRISEGVTLWYPYRITLGDKVTLNEWVYIDGFGGVKIGDGVRIAHRATILSSDHVYSDPDCNIHLQGLTKSETVIEDDVWIGCNVVILPGVRVGKGSVLAASSVVTKDVDAYSVMAGVPARQISYRGKAIED